MNKLYIVTMGANNQFTRYQWAFHNFAEAEKLCHFLDKEKGATSPISTIHDIYIFNTADEIIWNPIK